MSLARPWIEMHRLIRRGGHHGHSVRCFFVEQLELPPDRPVSLYKNYLLQKKCSPS